MRFNFGVVLVDYKAVRDSLWGHMSAVVWRCRAIMEKAEARCHVERRETRAMHDVL